MADRSRRHRSLRGCRRTTSPRATGVLRERPLSASARRQLAPVGRTAPWRRTDDPRRRAARTRPLAAFRGHVEFSLERRSAAIRRLDPARRNDLARREDRDLAEVAVNVHPDRSKHTYLLVIDDAELRWANDTDGFVLTAQLGQSQGRPLKTPGSQPISRRTACPACVLPERP